MQKIMPSIAAYFCSQSETHWGMGVGVPMNFVNECRPAEMWHIETVSEFYQLSNHTDVETSLKIQTKTFQSTFLG